MCFFELVEQLPAYQRTMQIDAGLLTWVDEPATDKVPEDLIKAILEALGEG
ncbi:MAG: hypothetical protein ACJAUG_001538 [Halioglobus sp.]